MAELNSVPVHSPSVVTRKTGKEYVLIPVTNNIADMNSVYTLNETGSFIWDQIDGRRSIWELTELLTAEYDIDRETALSDMMDFIDKMNRYLIIL